MVKKIEVIQTRRFVYEPDLEDSDSVYAEYDIETIEAAMALDEKDVKKGTTTIDDITDGDVDSVTYQWRIIDE